MSNKIIVIRPAELSDAESIRQLLLADYKNWSIETISGRIKNLFVLTCQNQILGVFYCSVTADKVEPYWVAVHPMYPESSLGTAIYSALQGVVKRQPIEVIAGNVFTITP